MKANYHTHTWRCHHAEPGEEKYVETALATGIRVLGFADHVPYPFDNGYRSGIRMDIEQADEYVDTLLKLREQYRGEIDIHIGFEAEYYPTYFRRLLERLEPLAYEYLLLGQHCLRDEQNAPYAGATTEDVSVLNEYVDQSTRALHTGAFSCFVHPDLINFVGDETVYRRAARTLCREAKACGVPLEINLLGLGDHRNYPRETFWEEAAVVGNPVILGWDAHSVAWMDQPDLEEKGMDIIRRLGLHQIDYLTLVRPHI